MNVSSPLHISYILPGDLVTSMLEKREMCDDHGDDLMTFSRTAVDTYCFATVTRAEVEREQHARTYVPCVLRAFDGLSRAFHAFGRARFANRIHYFLAENEKLRVTDGW